MRSERPPGLVDQRYTFAYIFAAVEPTTGRDFCLVLPEVSTAAMTVFLRRFAATLTDDEHGVMVIDGAGWHTSNDLVVPDNLSLLRLPPYSPQLNPVEGVWLFLRERHLSHRLHASYQAVLDAACAAWQHLTPERLRSLCGYSWIRQVTQIDSPV